MSNGWKPVPSPETSSAVETNKYPLMWTYGYKHTEMTSTDSQVFFSNQPQESGFLQTWELFITDQQEHLVESKMIKDEWWQSIVYEVD